MKFEGLLIHQFLHCGAAGRMTSDCWTRQCSHQWCCIHDEPMFIGIEIDAMIKAMTLNAYKTYNVTRPCQIRSWKTTFLQKLAIFTVYIDLGNIWKHGNMEIWWSGSSAPFPGAYSAPASFQTHLVLVVVVWPFSFCSFAISLGTGCAISIFPIWHNPSFKSPNTEENIRSSIIFLTRSQNAITKWLEQEICFGFSSQSEPFRSSVLSPKRMYFFFSSTWQRHGMNHNKAMCGKWFPQPQPHFIQTYASKGFNCFLMHIYWYGIPSVQIAKVLSQLQWGSNGFHAPSSNSGSTMEPHRQTATSTCSTSSTWRRPQLGGPRPG